MPIIKANPAPVMTVGHFKKAAVRHFHTCEYLWRSVETPAEDYMNGISDAELLENIFYLSGYIVECAIKYRFLTDIHALAEADAEDSWPRGIKTHFCFKTKDRQWSQSVVQQLDARTNYRIPQYLLTLGQATSQGDQSVEQVMQESWEPGIRYHYASNGLPLPPEKEHIGTFFKATKNLLQNLHVI